MAPPNRQDQQEDTSSEVGSEQSRSTRRLGIAPLRAVRRRNRRSRSRPAAGSIPGPAAPDESEGANEWEAAETPSCFNRPGSLLSRIGLRRRSVSSQATAGSMSGERSIAPSDGNFLVRGNSASSLSSLGSGASSASRIARSRAIQLIRGRRGAAWEVSEMAQTMLEQGQISQEELGEILESDRRFRSENGEIALTSRSPGEMALRNELRALSQRNTRSDSTLNRVDESGSAPDDDLSSPSDADSTSWHGSRVNTRSYSSSVDKPSTMRQFSMHRRSTTSTAVGTVRDSFSSGEGGMRTSLSSAWRRRSQPLQLRRRDTPQQPLSVHVNQPGRASPDGGTDGSASSTGFRNSRPLRTTRRRLSLSRLSRRSSRGSQYSGYVEPPTSSQEHVPIQYRQEMERVHEQITNATSAVSNDDTHFPSAGQEVNTVAPPVPERNYERHTNASEEQSSAPPRRRLNRRFRHNRDESHEDIAPHSQLSYHELRFAEHELRRTIQLASQRQQEAGGDGMVDESFIMSELRKMDPKVLGFNPNHGGVGKSGKKKKKSKRSKRRSNKTTPGAFQRLEQHDNVDNEQVGGIIDGSKSERLSSSRRSSRSRSSFSDDESVNESSSGSEDESRLLDPIMLTELEPDDVTYTFRRPNGSAIVYKVETLIDYMLSSGEFREPESRLEFSEADLAKIDAIAVANNMRKPSLVESVRNSSQQLEELREQHNILVGVERCLGEQISEILTVVEQAYSHEDGEMALVMRIFPNIRHYYQQLCSVDTEYAVTCVTQYKTFIKGPPNRRTKDRYNLIPGCMRFLDNLLANTY